MIYSSSKCPRHLTVGDVLTSSIPKARRRGKVGRHIEWIVRSVDDDSVAIVSSPGLGSARVQWDDAPGVALRYGRGHDLHFYFVRHEHDTES